MWRFNIAAALCAAVAGCGGTATLTGKVSYQGKPVLSGYVVAVHADGTARSGVILPDGTYTVEMVKMGRARLAVASPDPARARSILKKNPEAQASWFPLPPELGDPDKSGLACDVASSRVVFDIEK